MLRAASLSFRLLCRRSIGCSASHCPLSSFATSSHSRLFTHTVSTARWSRCACCSSQDATGVHHCRALHSSGSNCEASASPQMQAELSSEDSVDVPAERIFKQRSPAEKERLRSLESQLKDGRIPSLQQFMLGDEAHGTSSASSANAAESAHSSVPYLNDLSTTSNSDRKKVYIETYGCQMNVSDTEIVASILQQNGYDQTTEEDEADSVLLNTCAIRDNAEQKIWDRLYYFRSVRRKRKKTQPLSVGVLGCMAERLKKKLLETDKLVDVVVGPDAYRDLPRLLRNADDGQAGINVILSADETYADVAPVRVGTNGVHAFVSIMRGCNNMCSYCIVPFTRGRERSRPVESIVDEVRALSDQGYKEVVLLGQNVNSYNDTSVEEKPSADYSLARGFSTIYKKPDDGLRFADLVDRVSRVDSEMRIRFTSPHPKDFPDPLLHLIRERANVCRSIHIPAQSGSSAVLERMRRNHTVEAYIALIDHIREIVPDVSLSSDFISGFCGETEEDHQQTLSLLHRVKYDHAFMFAYSLREKTHAHRQLSDDVPHDVKQRRLREVIDTFYSLAREKNELEVGKTHLVLVEGPSRKNPHALVGKTDTNKKVVFEQKSAPVSYQAYQRQSSGSTSSDPAPGSVPAPGQYVAVRITSSSGVTLRGQLLAHSTIAEFDRLVTSASS
mmetsp:Transcript_32826/g.82401  ORF Transcript_32826/g.82401 Transcript_32826/m.82401 type:complete len:673 (-) Transcript_32826:41-2059(-)